MHLPPFVQPVLGPRVVVAVGAFVERILVLGAKWEAVAKRNWPTVALLKLHAVESFRDAKRKELELPMSASLTSWRLHLLEENLAVTAVETHS
jgi:hypothetical protein